MVIRPARLGHFAFWKAATSIQNQSGLGDLFEKFKEFWFQNIWPYIAKANYYTVFKTKIEPKLIDRYKEKIDKVMNDPYGVPWELPYEIDQNFEPPTEWWLIDPNKIMELYDQEEFWSKYFDEKYQSPTSKGNLTSFSRSNDSMQSSFGKNQPTESSANTQS